MSVAWPCVPPIGLVDHDPAVRQGVALALGAGREQERRHRGRLADAHRLHVAGQVLHGVVDGEAGGDDAAGRIDVERDVGVALLALQEEQLRDHDVGHVIIDRLAEDDDAVFQQAAVDVVGALAARIFFDDVRDGHGVPWAWRGDTRRTAGATKPRTGHPVSRMMRRRPDPGRRTLPTRARPLRSPAMRLLATALLVVALAPLPAAESLEQVIARTDMTDAEQVYQLAIWCRENNRPQSANTYLNQTVKLDKDHDGARTALGFVQFKGRWVHKSLLKPEDLATATTATGSGGTAVVARSAGPAPAAKDIDWQPKPPADPTPRDTWIQSYIDRMQTVGNDSDAMEISVKTLIDTYRETGIAKLCVAMARPEWRELYGPCRIVADVARAESGDLTQVRPLLPYLMLASARCDDADDLELFAYTIPMFQDRRSIPRLIELMGHSGKGVVSSSTAAVAKLTRLPAKGLTQAQAQAWWQKNHALSDETVLLEQLAGTDAQAVLAAAEGLYRLRSKAIMPALMKLLKDDDRLINAKAIALIKKVSGNDWSYDPLKPPAERTKIIAAMEKWWKDEGATFVWVEDRNAAPTTAAAAATPADPVTQLVEQLASTKGSDAGQAETSLRGMGERAVPALIRGLDHAQALVRRKCDALLREHTKTSVNFDASAEPEARSKGIEAWRAWARGQGINPDGASTAGSGADELR